MPSRRRGLPGTGRKADPPRRRQGRPGARRPGAGIAGERLLNRANIHSASPAKIPARDGPDAWRAGQPQRRPLYHPGSWPTLTKAVSK